MSVSLLCHLAPRLRSKSPALAATNVGYSFESMRTRVRNTFSISNPSGEASAEPLKFIELPKPGQACRAARSLFDEYSKDWTLKSVFTTTSGTRTLQHSCLPPLARLLWPWPTSGVRLISELLPLMAARDALLKEILASGSVDHYYIRNYCCKCDNRERSKRENPRSRQGGRRASRCSFRSSK